MNISDLLNPLSNNHNHNRNQNSSKNVQTRCISDPIISPASPANNRRYYERSQPMDLHHLHQQHLQHQNVIGKPRSRFSEYEDNIIRQGVAQRLTWGQISDLLPHRKRATCFNRYRTLQGIRKSRKLPEAGSPEMSSSSSVGPTSPGSCFSDPKTPPTSNYAQPNWFPSPSGDGIYDQQKHSSHAKYAASSYASDISSNSSTISDPSSDNNDDFPFTTRTTMTQRHYKIALPASSSPYYHRSTTLSSITSSTSDSIHPLCNL
ncbi:hypothetical protein [Parasitella parasitica]|uniref:Myb-like domain-containing protein n=1 Tax=Parasitella parasitica TaxID=35722 RepID=A0A0B7NKS2_9FUNG|nr:hypothetical protein [Parasitella parasitica]